MPSTSLNLLERLREPDAEQAWGRFVDLCTPLLFSWARQTGLAEPDAADLVQDVLATLRQKLPEFNEDSGRGFRPWVQNLLVEQYQRRSVHLQQTSPSHNVETVAPDAIFNKLKTDDYLQLLAARALQLMKPEMDEVTWKACWEHVVVGKPAAVVGAELRLSEAAVYAAKYRVLHRLRQELQGLID